MAALRGIAAAAAIVAASPGQAESVADWRPYIAEASVRFGVPVAWIERVMQAESRGRTRLDGRPIVSPTGAIGLMQVMPGTWADLRAAYGLGADPNDPRDNILAGTAYLRAMYDRFGYPGLFAAYNAGPARYAAYLAGTATLPGETRAYVTAVTGQPAVAAVSRTTEQSGVAALFATLRTAGSSEPDAQINAPGDGLFVIKNER